MPIVTAAQMQFNTFKKKDNKEILEFEKFKKKTPIVVVPTTYPKFNEKEMLKHGIKIVIYANHVLEVPLKLYLKH